MADNEDLNEGIDRRKVLTRGVAAAGVLWAVPAIQSFSNPAAAQVPPGTPTPGGDCEDGGVVMAVFVKYEVDQGMFVPADAVNNGTCVGGGCAAANAWAADQLQGIAIVNADGDQRVCITIPETFAMVDAAAAKEGGNCDTTPDTGSDMPNGVVCFAKEGRGGGVSNVTIEITVCVPAEVAAACE